GIPPAPGIRDRPMDVTTIYPRYYWIWHRMRASLTTLPNSRKIIPMLSSIQVRTLASLAVLLLGASIASAQLTPDQQADMLLNSARKAYNEKNHAFAAGKFREFLQKFGGHKEAPTARYGLALALLEGPEKKYDEARDLMQNLATLKDFNDRALAI